MLLRDKATGNVLRHSKLGCSLGGGGIIGLTPIVPQIIYAID
jgi:hypothetical protein